MKNQPLPDQPQRRPTRNKPVSLKDIAARAGVSHALVSVVLRGQMGNVGVREEVREKIIRIAAEMKYRPHSLAADLKVGRKGAIGVLFHSIGERGSELSEALLRGISAGFSQHGLRMWLTFFEFDIQLMETISIRMRHDVDGLIVAGVPHPSTNALIKELHAEGLPIVTMMEEAPIQGIANVSQDRYMQGRLAARHLLAKGCRRIAYMMTSDSNSRYRGIVDAHHEAGAEFLPELHYPCANFMVEQGEAAVAHWLAEGLTFDAVLAQSDHQASGAIQALQRAGLRVPDDVRVTGMDNSILAEAGPVKITSISSEMETVGLQLVDTLVALTKGLEVESRRIPVRLIERASA